MFERLQAPWGCQHHYPWVHQLDPEGFPSLYITCDLWLLWTLPLFAPFPLQILSWLLGFKFTISAAQTCWDYAGLWVKPNKDTFFLTCGKFSLQSTEIKQKQIKHDHRFCTYNRECHSSSSSAILKWQWTSAIVCAFEKKTPDRSCCNYSGLFIMCFVFVLRLSCFRD